MTFNPENADAAELGAIPPSLLTEQTLLSLGHGYDYCGSYADQSSVRAPIFDLGNEGTYRVVKSTGYEWAMAAGTTFREYYSKLGLSASGEGNYAGYRAQFEANFDRESLGRQTDVYLTKIRFIRYATCDLTPEAQLTNRARSAIETMEPEKLIDAYGTHYLRSASYGARVYFSSYVERRSDVLNTEWDGMIDAGYLDLVHGHAEVANEDREVFESVRANSKVSVAGGDPKYAAMLEDADFDRAAAYRQWSDTIEENPALIQTPLLRRISELAADEERKAIIDDAIDAHLAAHGVELLEVDPPEARTIPKNSTVHLKGPTGNYIGASYSGVEYYWPQLSPTALKLKLGGTGELLQSGDRIEILTSESWDGKWKARSRLGRFGGVGTKPVYYWDAYGDKTTWIIEKADRSQGAIEFGDAVHIKNLSYQEYLVEGSDGYLGTRSDNPDAWLFSKSG